MLDVSFQYVPSAPVILHAGLYDQARYTQLNKIMSDKQNWRKGPFSPKGTNMAIQLQVSTVLTNKSIIYVTVWSEKSTHQQVVQLQNIQSTTNWKFHASEKTNNLVRPQKLCVFKLLCKSLRCNEHCFNWQNLWINSLFSYVCGSYSSRVGCGLVCNGLFHIHSVLCE